MLPHMEQNFLQSHCSLLLTDVSFDIKLKNDYDVPDTLEIVLSRFIRVLIGTESRFTCSERQFFFVKNYIKNRRYIIDNGVE